MVNARVWPTDRRTDRHLIASPRLHSMQLSKKGNWRAHFQNSISPLLGLKAQKCTFWKVLFSQSCNRQMAPLVDTYCDYLPWTGWCVRCAVYWRAEMRGYISADRYFADIRSFLRIRIGYGYRFDGRRFFAKLIYLAHLTTWIVFTYFCIRMYGVVCT